MPCHLNQEVFLEGVAKREGTGNSQERNNSAIGDIPACHSPSEEQEQQDAEVK